MDRGDAGIEAGLIDVGQEHRNVQAPGEQQSQLPGHQAGADNADLGHIASEREIRYASGFPTPLLDEVERVHRRPELL